jgi:Arc/MetJ family transcription regulator
MRTNIDIDDALMAKAMTASGQRTKKGAVDEALRRLVRQEAQRAAIAEMTGLGWQGDLSAMRRDRTQRGRR